MYLSKSLVAVAILLACGTIAVSARDCPKACTLELNEVCATNGKEFRMFSNPCMLNVFSCEHESLWVRTKSLAPCLSTDTTAISADTNNCITPCTFEYNPVCAYDGHHFRFFDNECEMHNAECGTDKHYEIAKNYMCVPHPAALKLCDKACTYEYNPVCGFNGDEHKVFPNHCVMENEHCKDHKVWKQSRMQECETIETISVDDKKTHNCEKPCNRMYRPVCGTDGQQYKVFSNECIMENEHCKDNHEWSATTFALCEEPQQIKTDFVKACPLIYAPVCGTDGQTYKMFDNKCMLEYAEETSGHHWSVASFALCEEPQQVKEDCVIICPRMYAPVCGSDGQTYKVFDNLCLLEKQHECDGHNWQQTTFGLCENPIPLSAAPKFDKYCEKPCNKMLSPVCGTDGQNFKVFSNKCIMENEHCKDHHEWSATTFALCEEPQQIKTDFAKACPLIYAPVCGTDGQTYKMFDNKCMLEYAEETSGHHWSVASFALCEEPQQVKEDCVIICPRMYAPVCGSDGQTYKVFDNLCLLEKQHECDGHNWQQTTFGLCENPIPLSAAPKFDKYCEKPCNKMLSPVCGTDGQNFKVFSNKCIMENEHCKDHHEWSATTFALCEEPQQIKTDFAKACPLIYAPVCGTDGQTYKMFDNKCMLEYAEETSGHHWSVASFALCEEPQQVKEDCVIICPRMYAPVCGSDGQTYKVFDNLCLLEKQHECDGHNWQQTTFGLCENPIPLSAAPKFDKYCEKPCNRMLSPVCGTDGQNFKVFDNECIMENEHCKDHHEWSATTFGLCENSITLASETKKDCQMICPFIFLPTCGFNGKTHTVFGNPCELNVYNCLNNEHFVATFMNECQAQN